MPTDALNHQLGRDEVKAALHELAELPPGDAPFISLYLDMRVDATGTRRALTFLKAALTRQARRFGPRGSARESFLADAGRIQTYLADEFDVAAQGVAIFACHARGYFRALPLAVPPINRLTVAQAPRLYQLARLLDDYTTYCVVVLSRTRARIFTIALGDITTAAELSGPRYQVSKTRAGGWAEGRYQRHVEQHIRTFARDVADALTKVCAQYAPARVVLAGETVALADLERALAAETTGEATPPVVRLDADVPEHQVLAALLPLVAQAERQEEADTVNELEAACAHDLAVVGAEPTLFAMEQGQVDKLVISDRFAEKGWRCGRCLSYGVGGVPERCGYCGGNVVEADLRESLVGAAERMGAAIEFVWDVPRLDQLGGVGAFLRYPLT